MQHVERDTHRQTAEGQPGGLLATGTVVRVDYPDDRGTGSIEGTILAVETLPAPYISLQRNVGDTRILIFLGPGVTIAPVIAHPGLS